MRHYLDHNATTAILPDVLDVPDALFMLTGDMFIFDKWNMEKEPALLIGMDVIGSLDTLIIDYRMRELHMRARR